MFTIYSVLGTLNLVLLLVLLYKWNLTSLLTSMMQKEMWSVWTGLFVVGLLCAWCDTISVKYGMFLIEKFYEENIEKFCMLKITNFLTNQPPLYTWLRFPIFFLCGNFNFYGHPLFPLPLFELHLIDRFEQIIIPFSIHLQIGLKHTRYLIRLMRNSGPAW